MHSKTDIIKKTIEAKYDIVFDIETFKVRFKKKDEKDFADITPDVVKTFRADLHDNGISVTPTDIRKALNMTFFDKEKDLVQSEEIEMFLDTFMESRFNTIKQKPEYRIYGEEDFVPVGKFDINSINRKIRSKGLKTSKEALSDILHSDYSVKVNPIKDYFEQLPEYSETEGNHILELANTVEVANPDKWNEYLKKWLVAVVANVMIDENCKNHTMLVLTGEQGTFKTTWLDNLCPEKLKRYLFTGKIDPSNKDTQTYLAEFFLVNVDDQLKQLNKKDENDLKNMITAPNVKYRRPYDAYLSEYPHVCSFMGSVNGNDFLTDPTGSRRFLAFEVVQIHIEKAKALNIDLVWKQAYHLFKTGFRYWFTGEEIEQLHISNSDFQMISPEEQFLLKFFEKPERRDLATHELQPAEILSRIQAETTIHLRLKQLGEALQKHGFEKWRKTDKNIQKWVYSVVKLEYDQIRNGETTQKESAWNDLV